MAAVSSLLSEDQFLCSICLDVFTDPVTTPCGHNFCKACITKHWNTNVPCQCPLCKEECEIKPELRVNTVLSEMAAQFKQSLLRESNSEEPNINTNTGEVFCDFCTETKQKALKSCLDCLISYCETHLEPHRRLPALKRHRLINPVENLESRVCKKHGRPLEQFCKTDQVCVCSFCTEAEHKLHRIVFLDEEYKEKKAELGKTEAGVQTMIQERQLKIEEIERSVKLSKENADQETATCMEVYTALIWSVEKSLAQLLDSIMDEHETIKIQAEYLILELEEEISELMMRSTELEQFSNNEDHLDFLQNFMALKSAPPTKDWTTIEVHTSYEGILKTSLAQLEETLRKEMEVLPAEAEIKREGVKQYWVDVTLDPETAHPKLILSSDGKQVYHGNVCQNVHDTPKRISSYFCVLGKQGFSSGRFYYEVQVEEKTDWFLGVARESIPRKNPCHFCPQNGFWTVSLKDGCEYKALVDIDPIHLDLKSKPQKVGVFVDFEEGLVCFYDMDASSLIHTFTGCNFTETLYPIFSPRKNNAAKNSAPLTILPINHNTNQTDTFPNVLVSGNNEACASGGAAIGL